MSTSPSYLELVHGIAVACRNGAVSIKSFLRGELKKAGFTGGGLDAAVASRYSRFVREIDEHVNSFDRRRIAEYFSRDPDRPTHVISLTEAEQFTCTAAVQYAMTQMGPRDFEYLAANLMADYGLARMAVTRAGNDGGFDFVAYSDVDEDLAPDENYTGPHWFMGMRVFVFGQAKRYAVGNPISPEALTLLKGSIAALKEGGGTAALNMLLEALEVWEWTAASTTRGVFVTSGFYNSTAPGFAEQHAMTFIDGEQLAQCLLRRLPQTCTLDDAMAELANLGAGPFGHVEDLDVGDEEE